jgi:DNA-binding transcriptional LysR family regulator
MKRADLADLVAFRVVAEEGSFTRAAGRLAMSQSALSHAMRSLEERLGVPLLSRTTRRVATTEAGEELLRSLSPAFKEIELGLLLLGANRSKAAGTVRLTMSEHAALQLIRPILSSFIDAYPDINVEVDANDGFVDIIAERFDAGIRRGEHLQKDMVARFCRVVDQTAEIGRKRSCAPHTGRTTPAIAENWSANDIASAPSISN